MTDQQQQNEVLQKVYSNKAGLSDLVQYADDSVVSKTLIKKKTGTLTLFAFDKGQGLSTHQAPFDAMVQILDGEALITISEKEHTLGTGEVIIMPADQPHSVQALRRFKMLLTMIRE